jgi:hypothetical protein
MKYGYFGGSVIRPGYFTEKCRISKEGESLMVGNPKV